jgi:energy-coupling factor transporter ATP-binding protein EcfA2
MSAGNRFDSFASDQPLWLQTAGADLLSSNRQPTSPEITRLVDLAVAEATNKPASFREIPPSTFTHEPLTASTTLLGLQSPTGINALTPSAKLDFGQANLVVIYGPNGTGKSSYARVLKHATGNRAGKAILSNVFNANPVAKSCVIRLRRPDGTDAQHTWTDGAAPHDDLRGVHIFDSDVAHLYLQQALEASYEPRRLRFITQLIDIATAVSEELKRRIADQTQSAPQPPQHLAASKLAEWLRDLKLNISAEELNQKLEWTEADSARKANLEDALRQPNPAEHLAKVKQDLLMLERLQLTHVATLKSFSDDAIRAIAAARSSAIDARQAVEDLAKVAFAAASLPGVGESSWRAMWEAAREYSTKSAYPGCGFPHVGPEAKCPLCQQPLDAVAADRLTGFDAFVRNQLEAKAKLAEHQLQTLMSALPQLPHLADWLARYGAAGVGEADLLAAYAALQARHAAAGVAGAGSEIPAADLTELSTALDARIQAKRSEAGALEAAAAPDQRPVLTAELNELKAKEWASGNIAEFQALLVRLASLRDLEAAKKLCSTTALTTTKGKLAEVEVEKGYIERFKAELVNLGGERLKVAPDVKERKKGKVLFHLKLDGATEGTKVADVLSEGEARIVALATFLADLTVSSSRSPFIFDDPISSLDQEFEERVVARLVDLARTRQVVVFTHRLSLLTALSVAGKGSGIVEIALGRDPPGMPMGIPLQCKKVDGAARQLQQRVATAKRAARDSDYETAELTMRSVCADFRIVVERAVEAELLGATVTRFRINIETLKGFDHLAKITLADTRYLDSLMGKLSKHVHAPTVEFPPPTPQPAEIDADLEVFIKWMETFKVRPIPLIDGSST